MVWPAMAGRVIITWATNVSVVLRYGEALEYVCLILFLFCRTPTLWIIKRGRDVAFSNFNPKCGCAAHAATLRHTVLIGWYLLRFQSGKHNLQFQHSCSHLCGPLQLGEKCRLIAT